MKKVIIVVIAILAISILAGYFYAAKAQDSTKKELDSIIVVAKQYYPTNTTFTTLPTDTNLVTNPISFLDKLILKKAALDSQIVQIEKEMKACASGDTTWHTGKRGGQYYINQHGNKVYRKRK